MSADVMAGLESCAVNLIKRAILLDTQKRYTESLICYQEGIQLLMQVMKESQKMDQKKASAIRTKVSDYMDRAEVIKTYIDNHKSTGRYHEQILVQENSTGFSYESVMSRFLREECKSVEIDDPYIRTHYQILNFLRFCELVVKSDCGVKVIKLKTGVDKSDSAQQKQKLEQIAQSLKAFDICLSFEFSESLHDREIRLSNCWVIKIGRGLDYFKPPDNNLSIGACDYDLRRCHETTIDIFYKLP